MIITDEQIAEYFENLHEKFDQTNGWLSTVKNHCPACIFAHVAKIYGLEGWIEGDAFYRYTEGFEAYCNDRDLTHPECSNLFHSHGLKQLPYGANQWNIPAAQVFRAIADAKYPRD